MCYCTFVKEFSMMVSVLLVVMDYGFSRVCNVIILLCCSSNAIRWNHLNDAMKRSFERATAQTET